MSKLVLSRKGAGGTWRAVLSVVAVSAVLASTTSCSSDSSEETRTERTTSSGAGTAQSGDADPTKTVRFSYKNPPTTWDPITDPGTFTWMLYESQVYDRLIGLNADGTLGPMLATEWTTASDGRALTLKLRDDVSFHDGSTFDSSVAIANLNRAKGPDLPTTATMANVASMTAPDPSTVVLEFTDPDFGFVNALALRAGFIVSPKGLEDVSSLETQPAGSGPFKLVSYDSSMTVLERNDAYWDKTLELPARKEILAIADDAARLNALQAGQIDGATLEAQFAQALQLESGGKYYIKSAASTQLNGLLLNTKNPALTPDVRRAISLALDREGISKVLYEETCVPNSEVFPPGMAGYVDSLKPEYNVAEAKRILESAGASNLTLSTIILGDRANFREYAAVLKDQLAEVGVTLDLVPITASLARGEWRTGNYDAAAFATLGDTPDPAGVMNNYMGPDTPGGPDPQVAALYDEAKQLPLGDERTSIFEDISTYLYETPTHIPVCSVGQYVILSEKLLNGEEIVGQQLSSAVDTRSLVVAKD